MCPIRPTVLFFDIRFEIFYISVLNITAGLRRIVIKNIYSKVHIISFMNVMSILLIKYQQFIIIINYHGKYCREVLTSLWYYLLVQILGHGMSLLLGITHFFKRF